MNRMSIADLPLEVIGVEHGIDVSDCYEELHLLGEASLCLGCLIAEAPRRKILHYHFALFGPQFGDMKCLSFDIRELLAEPAISLPVKSESRLKMVADLLMSRFGTDQQLLNEVLSTRAKQLKC